MSICAILRASCGKSMMLGATAWLVLSAGGCGRGLNDIDARTRRAMEMTSARMGEAVTPDRRFEGERGGRAARETNRQPGTTNPAAEALRYERASESRDVAGRLDGYTQQAGISGADGARRLDLNEVFRIAQRTAPDYLSAEEDYVLAAIRLLIERHLWGPRLFNDTSVTVGGTGVAGTFTSALNVINDLRVTQRLPYGGEVEAKWIMAATQQLQETASGGYIQSSTLVFSGNVPLLRGAGLVAQESLIQAERDLVYRAREFEDFRRRFLVEIARDYYALLEAKNRLANQENRLKLLENITVGETARYEAGRIAEFRRNIAQNNLLSARASLAGQREAFIVQIEQFKIKLGLSSTSPVELALQELDLPEPEVSLEAATAAALEFRLDLQNQRDRLDDTRRAVANARQDLLPSLNANASVSVPTDPTQNVGQLGPSPGDLTYRAGITFGLPLDREQERLRLRAATIDLQRAEREFGRFRDTVAVNVRQAVRQVDLARFQLTLAERQVEINRRRVLETELKAAEVDTQQKVDAVNELQQSENDRDRARTNLRNAVLEYLRLSGQLRVSPDGTLQRLPGMDGESKTNTAPSTPDGAAP